MNVNFYNCAKYCRDFLRIHKQNCHRTQQMPPLGIYSKDTSIKSSYQRDTSSTVYCSTVCNSQDVRSTKVSMSIRMDKENVGSSHSGVLLSHESGE